MRTSKLKRVVSRSLVILAAGLSLFSGAIAVDIMPNGGAHVAYADPAGPNPPPDPDRPATPTPTATPVP